MHQLKEILREKTYAEVVMAVKQNNMKLADLSKGDYVGKGKYESLCRKLAHAKQTIEKLKSTAGQRGVVK